MNAALPVPPIREFNWFDAVALGLMLLLAWRGYRRGALGWIAGLGSSLLALALALALAPAVGQLVAGHSGVGSLIGQRAAFVVLLIVLRVLLGWALHELVAAIRPLLRALPPLSLLEHLLGVIPSLALGALLLLVLLGAALLLPIDRRLHDAAAGSFVGRLTIAEADRAVELLSRGGLPAVPALLRDLERELPLTNSLASPGRSYDN